MQVRGYSGARAQSADQSDVTRRAVLMLRR